MTTIFIIPPHHKTTKQEDKRFCQMGSCCELRP